MVINAFVPIRRANGRTFLSQAGGSTQQTVGHEDVTQSIMSHYGSLCWCGAAPRDHMLLTLHSDRGEGPDGGKSSSGQFAPDFTWLEFEETNPSHLLPFYCLYIHVSILRKLALFHPPPRNMKELCWNSKNLSNSIWKKRVDINQYDV